NQVQATFQRYLHRAPDPAGVPGVVNFLMNGGTVEQLAQSLVASQEYFNLHGATNDGFQLALFEDALGRPSDPLGGAALTQQLIAGLSRGQLAAMVFGSAEYETNLVQAAFQALLGRDADPAGLPGFVTTLQQTHTSDPMLLTGLLGSEEAFGHRN